MVQVERKPAGMGIFNYVLLFSSVIILPGIEWPLFSWLNGFVPLAAFLFLYGFGWNTGSKIVVQGVVLAFAVCFFLRTLPLYVLALTCIPAGYIIARSAVRSENQISAGTKGILALGTCWLVFWGGLIVLDSSFSYSALIHGVQDWMDVLMNAYRNNKSIPVDTLIAIEQMLNQTKTYFPVILPAILCNFVIMTIWFTMVCGNRLALKYIGKAPWPEYKLWKLPDKLIWAAIVAGIFALLPAEPLRTIGINLLIPVSVLFVFQGLSIVVFFFNKWKMPIFFRVPLYVLAVIQSSGTIILLILGIADIWLDIRRLNQQYEDLK